MIKDQTASVTDAAFSVGFNDIYYFSRMFKRHFDVSPSSLNNSLEEGLAVAKAKGYDLGEDYLTQALDYLEKVGVHKDSMCFDIANKTRTEIDFLGQKVVEYGRETGVPTPCYATMANLAKTMENKYLEH